MTHISLDLVQTASATRVHHASVLLALLTVYLAWGATYPAIRVLGEAVPPLIGMGARFLLAGLVLFAVLEIWDRRPAGRERPSGGYVQLRWAYGFSATSG